MFNFASSASVSAPFLNAALLEAWVQDSGINFEPGIVTVSFGTDHPEINMDETVGVCVMLEDVGSDSYWVHLATLPKCHMEAKVWKYHNDGIHGGSKRITLVISRTGAVRIQD